MRLNCSFDLFDTFRFVACDYFVVGVVFDLIVLLLVVWCLHCCLFACWRVVYVWFVFSDFVAG